MSNIEASYLVLINFLMLAKRRVIELGSEHGLTGMQTMTLFLLDRPKPMNSFTKIFNCDASNVTGIIDGLEQKQLAARYENPDDRRIKMVKLQDKGRKTRNALLHDLSQQDSRLHSRLSPQEFDTFVRLLQKITD